MESLSRFPLAAALALAAALLLAGCTQGGTTTSSTSIPANFVTTTLSSPHSTVQAGDTVGVDYTGTLDNGTVFDTSIQAEAQKAGLPPRPPGAYVPLSFKVGSGQVIAGFDAAVKGMSIGESKDIILPPDQAYGGVDPSRIVNVSTPQLSGQLNRTVKVGMVLSTSGGFSGTVVATDPTNTTVDFNYPLAGKTLHFHLTLRSIQ